MVNKSDIKFQHKFAFNIFSFSCWDRFYDTEVWDVVSVAETEEQAKELFSKEHKPYSEWVFAEFILEGVYTGEKTEPFIIYYTTPE